MKNILRVTLVLLVLAATGITSQKTKTSTLNFGGGPMPQCGPNGDPCLPSIL